MNNLCSREEALDIKGRRSHSRRFRLLHNICIERACLTEIFRTSEAGARFIDKCFARWKGEYYAEMLVFPGDRSCSLQFPVIFRDFHRGSILLTPKLLSPLFTSFRIRPMYNTCRASARATLSIVILHLHIFHLEAMPFRAFPSARSKGSGCR